jgi:hypothetical protein
MNAHSSAVYPSEVLAFSGLHCMYVSLSPLQRVSLRSVCDNRPQLCALLECPGPPLPQVSLLLLCKRKICLWNVLKGPPGRIEPLREILEQFLPSRSWFKIRAMIIIIIAGGEHHGADSVAIFTYLVVRVVQVRMPFAPPLLHHHHVEEVGALDLLGVNFGNGPEAKRWHPWGGPDFCFEENGQGEGGEKERERERKR